ncbi:MAG: RNA polymerase sigma factor [Bacteroidales bacterium]
MANTKTKNTGATNPGSMDEYTLQKIYAENYYKTERFIITNSGNAEEAKDVYQEAFLVLWQKLRSGELSIQDNNYINAFLYRVVRNKWIDHLRSREFNAKSYLNDSTHNNLEEPDNEKDKEWEKKADQVAQWIKKLKPDCRKLLRGFYFDRMSMRALAKQFLIDEASAKNKKYRCMEKLKKLVFDKL